MNTEHIEIVMNEFSEELKTTNKAITDMATAFNTLQHKVAGFEEKLANQQLTASADTAPIQEIVKKGMTNALLIAARQPKSVTKKFQILLFPEQDAKLFYKIVFGRWFICLLLALFIDSLYKIAIHSIDEEFRHKSQQIQYKELKGAWNYIYNQEGKAGRRRMDTAYLKALKDEAIE